MRKLHESNEKRKRRTFDLAERMRLYKLGISDFGIAADTGCCYTAVASWRRRNDLRPSFPRRTNGYLALIIRRNLHLPNAEIAMLADCSTAYVRAFRQREAAKALRAA